MLTDFVSQYFGFWVGFQLGPYKKDLDTAFDGSENLQKGQRSAKNSGADQFRANASKPDSRSR